MRDRLVRLIVARGKALRLTDDGPVPWTRYPSLVHARVLCCRNLGTSQGDAVFAEGLEALEVILKRNTARARARANAVSDLAALLDRLIGG